MIAIILQLAYSINDLVAQYVNFDYALTWDMTYMYAVGFLLFIAMVKLMRLLRFNVKIVELSSTLRVSLGTMSAFFLYFIIVLCAFAQWGYAVFGNTNVDYYSFITTLETLISMMLMSFNYNLLVAAYPAMGNLFFVLYILFVGFVLLNMMVAILDESACAVREGQLLSSDDFMMVDYVARRIRKFFGGDEPEEQEGENRFSLKFERGNILSWPMTDIKLINTCLHPVYISLAKIFCRIDYLDMASVLIFRISLPQASALY